MDNKTKIAVLSATFSKNEILRNEIGRYFDNIKYNLTGKGLKTEEINY